MGETNKPRRERKGRWWVLLFFVVIEAWSTGEVSGCTNDGDCPSHGYCGTGSVCFCYQSFTEGFWEGSSCDKCSSYFSFATNCRLFSSDTVISNEYLDVLNLAGSVTLENQTAAGGTVFIDTLNMNAGTLNIEKLEELTLLNSFTVTGSKTSTIMGKPDSDFRFLATKLYFGNSTSGASVSVSEDSSLHIIKTPVISYGPVTLNGKMFLEGYSWESNNQLTINLVQKPRSISHKVDYAPGEVLSDLRCEAPGRIQPANFIWILSGSLFINALGTTELTNSVSLACFIHGSFSKVTFSPHNFDFLEGIQFRSSYLSVRLDGSPSRSLALIKSHKRSYFYDCSLINLSYIQEGSSLEIESSSDQSYFNSSLLLLNGATFYPRPGKVVFTDLLSLDMSEGSIFSAQYGYVFFNHTKAVMRITSSVFLEDTTKEESLTPRITTKGILEIRGDSTLDFFLGGPLDFSNPSDFKYRRIPLAFCEVECIGEFKTVIFSPGRDVIKVPKYKYSEIQDGGKGLYLVLSDVPQNPFAPPSSPPKKKWYKHELAIALLASAGGLIGLIIVILGIVRCKQIPLPYEKVN